MQPALGSTLGVRTRSGVAEVAGDPVDGQIAPVAGNSAQPMVTSFVKVPIFVVASTMPFLSVWAGGETMQPVVANARLFLVAA